MFQEDSLAQFVLWERLSFNLPVPPSNLHLEKISKSSKHCFDVFKNEELFFGIE